MKKTNLSLKQARQIVLKAQFLDGRTALPSGKEGVAQTIDGLGYVQIDTISVIKRSHHHTLWIRRGDYDENMLHDLQSKDRLVFEYWTHAMSYLPMSDFRYSLPRMRNFLNPTSPWARHQWQKSGHLVETVLERIRKEGPLSSKDFASSEKKGGTWWDWKPAKVALELLFWRGDLMITERQNFQKIYDLTDRVLPDHIDTTMPDDDEVGQFFVRRAISALGIAGQTDIQRYMQPGTARDSDLQIAGKNMIEKALRDLLDAREVIPVTLEENENAVYYVLSDAIQNIVPNGETPGSVFFLSPFDNLIIQRQRTKRLFGFDYALECYVPVEKRKYGYFVLPILWGDRFVGRLDPKSDRKTKTLVVKSLIFEPSFKSFDTLLPLLAQRFVGFARFNGCEHIAFEKVSPKKYGAPLRRLVKGGLSTR
jgi:uncharacterized protein YcaQ